MTPFLRSLKYSRNIENIYKHIRINDSCTNTRSLSQVSNNATSLESESPNSVQQYTWKRATINSQNAPLWTINKMDFEFKKAGLMNKRSINDIITYIEETGGKIKSAQALSIIHNSTFLPDCTSQERVKLATTIWEILHIYHVPLDVSHYNALLQLYTKNEYEFSPLEILSDMKKQGISPNKSTYQCILEYYCKKGNMSEVSVILESMKAENYPINENIFNLLILGYSQANDLTNAINILNIMKKMDIVPSDKTYTAVMCAYAKVNDIESINIVLSHCKEKGIKLSKKHLLDIIYALISNNNMDHIDEVLNKIRKSDCIAEIYFLSKVMDTKQKIAIELFYSILSKNKDKISYKRLVCFFINKLMFNNVCPEEIVKACIHLETQYNDKQAFSQAIYFSFQHNNDLVTFNLLKAWKDRGHKLAPHYFWPILAKQIKKNDLRGILWSVKDMINTYDVMPCIDTLADFVIPHLFYDIYEVRNVLLSYRISNEIVNNAIAYYFLKHNKIRRAAAYVSTNIDAYEESILKYVLQRAFYNKGDISSYLTVVRNMYKTEQSGEVKKVSINEAILDVLEFLNIHDNLIPQTIKYLHENQLKISTDVYKALSLPLRNKSSLDTLDLLMDVTENSSIKDKEVRKQQQMQVADVKKLKLSAETSMSLYRKFLQVKKNNDVDIDLYIYLVNALLESNLIPECKVIMKYFATDYPTNLTAEFVLKQVAYLTSRGHHDDATEIINNVVKVIKVSNKKRVYDTICNILNNIAATGNDETVHIVFNVLLKAKYVKPSRRALHPLVMVHIRQGNVLKALEMSELFCQKYKCIPTLYMLMKSVILTRDANLLQRLIDCSTQLYEVNYVLGGLMMCCLENNYEDEAQRIIKIFVKSNWTLEDIKTLLFARTKNGETKAFEKLLDYTKEYPEINRVFIYRCLLRIYDTKNNYQDALKLWTRLMSEDIVPPNDFVDNFICLFRRNNVDTSFMFDMKQIKSK